MKKKKKIHRGFLYSTFYKLIKIYFIRSILQYWLQNCYWFHYYPMTANPQFVRWKILIVGSKLFMSFVTFYLMIIRSNRYPFNQKEKNQTKNRIL
jgi:hypothetical protein